MAARLSAVQREEYGTKAVIWSAQGVPDSTIAKRLKVNPKTVKKLRDDTYAIRAEKRNNDIEKHLASYEAVQRAAWKRFKKTPDSSLNNSAYLSVIRAAEDSKVKLTGAEAPKRLNVNVTEQIPEEELAFISAVEEYVRNAGVSAE
jgi:hypothetical protein